MVVYSLFVCVARWHVLEDGQSDSFKSCIQYPLFGDLKNSPVPVDDGSGLCIVMVGVLCMLV